MPPLRERREDIPELIDYFLMAHSAMFKCDLRPISARLMQVLHGYEWPGNIRQLENLIKRYVILGNEDAIMSDLASGGSLASHFRFRPPDSHRRTVFAQKSYPAGSP